MKTHRTPLGLIGMITAFLIALVIAPVTATAEDFTKSSPTRQMPLEIKIADVTTNLMIFSDVKLEIDNTLFQLGSIDAKVADNPGLPAALNEKHYRLATGDEQRKFFEKIGTIPALENSSLMHITLAATPSASPSPSAAPQPAKTAKTESEKEKAPSSGAP